jgi:PKD repeat protein
MFFDTRNGVVVLYGGAGDSGVLNDIWVFDSTLQTWTQVSSTNTAPEQRYLSAVAYAPNTGCAYVVNGVDSSGALTSGIYQLCVTRDVSGGNQSPIANIAASPTSGAVGTVFSLMGGASIDPDGIITAYNWTFGDGSSASGATVTKTYTAPGSYTVTLTVTDNQGATGSATTILSVATNQPPTVSLTSPTNGAAFTAPATVNLAANASDPDGTVAHVDFYRGTTLIASNSTAPYTYTDAGLPAGTYTYSAIAYDNNGASTTSSTSTITVAAASPTGINVAAQTNGGIASASSSYNANYAPAGANNGDRKGLNWANGGGWNDATAGAFPDWLQVTFSATQSIGEIDVFTVQDNYQAPADPTPTMTFSQYGIAAFEVQYWNGSAWIDVPGGNVSGNNLVWRKFSFAPITTDRIRVLVNNALNSYSRITEIEAWTSP